ncbi:MAG: hypothetical protein IPK82_33355 [Polyangiaceae bacterium]|nr:hypothetical protein [Polyangiaceae bacterium]
MTQIVANWVTTGSGTNVVVVGDPAKNLVQFEFASAPQKAEKVVITIVEKILDLDGKPRPSDADNIKLFTGKLENGKFVASGFQMGKKRSNLKNNEFKIADPEKKNIMRGFIDDPERVSEHVLTLKTSHDIKGKSVEFVGTQEVQVRFPLAMVIPKGKATLDTALNMIGKYASNWKSKDAPHRHVEETKMVVTKSLKGTLEPSVYDDIVRAIAAAADKATGGIVALSVGHGGMGTVDTVPFVNLIPEDNKKAQTGVPFLARVDQTDLAPYDKPPAPGSVKSTPGRNTQVRLDALDRIGDALQGKPIRRLLLHTCNAGNSPDFIQFLANRLRIPVFAQMDFIWFQPAASFYDKDGQPVLPRDEKFWPIHRSGEVKIPDPVAPPRFGPPKS